MRKVYLLLGISFILLWGCKKENVDDTPNTNITMEGDVIRVSESPVSNPKKMEIFGMALKKKDLSTFNKKLSSNQYGFKALKENEMVDYDAMWDSFYSQYLVVMRTTGSYAGEDITLNVTTGDVHIGERAVRVFELGYIFTDEKEIPVGSGVATLLNAKEGEEYNVVWLLITHGENDDHNFITITHMNKDDAIQAKSIYKVIKP